MKLITNIIHESIWLKEFDKDFSETDTKWPEFREALLIGITTTQLENELAYEEY